MQHIGKTLGNVLRVDTFTAFESRGRFARLCIQIDVDKPLITTILLGKLEQLILYEGIQRFCFGCGRVGHRRESYPYIIRQETPCKAAMEDESDLGGANSHDMCDSDKQRTKVGTTNVRHDIEQDSTHEGVYGPWVVVTRRKNGTKSQRSGGPSIEKST